MKNWLVALITIFIIGVGCKENYTPKPHGFLRIQLPKDHSYIKTPKTVPFSSKHSKYAEWESISNINLNGRKSLWYNIYYPSYNAKIHLSYLTIENNLDSILEESHKFVFEHTIRADAINESTISNDTKEVHSVIFDLEGNSASNMEFWSTDSTEHFLRGALYFQTTPNVDSLQPIINYIKEDLIYFVANLEWNAINN